MKDSEVLVFIRNCPKDLSKYFKTKTFKYGQKLLTQGEIATHIYILIDGTVKTYYSDYMGLKYLEDIDTSETVFGELEALVNKEIVTSVEAISDCKTIEIPIDIFIKWMELDNKFSLYISRLIAQRNYDSCLRERTNAIYPLRYRIIYFIYNTLYKNNLVITKDLIVEGVGSNIRSINRILKQLIDENIIKYKSGTICIESIDKLKKELDDYKKSEI